MSNSDTASRRETTPQDRAMDLFREMFVERGEHADPTWFITQVLSVRQNLRFIERSRPFESASAARLREAALLATDALQAFVLEGGATAEVMAERLRAWDE